jgi:hypothetical protein
VLSRQDNADGANITKRNILGKSAQLDSQSAVRSVEFQEDEFAEKLSPGPR